MHFVKEVNKLLKNHKTIPQHIQSFLLPNNNGIQKCFTLSEKLPCKWMKEKTSQNILAFS